MPNTDWPAAYNKNIEATSTIAENKIFSMLVDYVRIDSITNFTSIDKQLEDLETKLSFFPNPAHTNIYFSEQENIKVSIYDLTGRKIIEKEVNYTLPINLSPGVYVIKYGKNNNSIKIIL